MRDALRRRDLRLALNVRACAHGSEKATWHSFEDNLPIAARRRKRVCPGLGFTARALSLAQGRRLVLFRLHLLLPCLGRTIAGAAMVESAHLLHMLDGFILQKRAALLGGVEDAAMRRRVVAADALDGLRGWLCVCNLPGRSPLQQHVCGRSGDGAGGPVQRLLRGLAYHLTSVLDQLVPHLLL